MPKKHQNAPPLLHIGGRLHLFKGPGWAESDRLAAEKGLGMPRQPIPPPLHWEIASSIWMARKKSSTHILPCITKSHVIWNVSDGVPWLGKQLLCVQGFPKDLKFHYNDQDKAISKPIHTAIQSRLRGKVKITDLDLRCMAGNTMSVPVMGALQVAVVIQLSTEGQNRRSYVLQGTSGNL